MTERKRGYATMLKENRRHLLVHPKYLRSSDLTLDNPRTTIEDLEWVIAYHQKQIELATTELARRVQLERKRWTHISP